MVTHAVLNPSPSLPKSNRSAVLITACCGVFVSFASVVVYTFGVFLKPLAGTFHWSRTQVSLAFTLAALTVAICSPFLGRLLDRFPARRVVLPCAVIYAAAFGSLAFLTPHLWHLYGVFVIVGIVGNGTTQLGYARVVSAWFDKQRGQALAAVMAGSGLGSMVFPPVAQMLISTYGWRVAYGALGLLIAAVSVPLGWFFLYEPREATMPEQKRTPEKVGKSVRSGPFLGIALALLLFSFATNGLNAHWAALLTDRGIPAAQAALVLSVAGCAALVSKLGTGYLLDRFRAGRVAGALVGLCALGFIAIVTGGNALWLAVASAILVGLGMGAESDAVPYLLTRYFGLSRFSELYGYTWCVYAVAGASGPAAMGAVFDHTGSYRLMLITALILTAAAAVVFVLLPRYSPVISQTEDYVGATPSRSG